MVVDGVIGFIIGSTITSLTGCRSVVDATPGSIVIRVVGGSVREEMRILQVPILEVGVMVKILLWGVVTSMAVIVVEWDTRTAVWGCGCGVGNCGGCRGRGGMMDL